MINSPNLLQWRNKLNYISDGLRVSTCSVHFHFPLKPCSYSYRPWCKRAQRCDCQAIYPQNPSLLLKCKSDSTQSWIFFKYENVRHCVRETRFKRRDVAELSAAFATRRMCCALTCFQKLSQIYTYSKYNRPSPLGVKNEHSCESVWHWFCSTVYIAALWYPWEYSHALWPAENDY